MIVDAAQLAHGVLPGRELHLRETDPDPSSTVIVSTVPVTVFQLP